MTTNKEKYHQISVKQKNIEQQITSANKKINQLNVKIEKLKILNVSKTEKKLHLNPTETPV